MRNYYVMAGFSSMGIALSGGVGQLLAELIVHGRSSLGYWPVDIQRFSPHHNNKAFLRDRVTEIEGTLTLFYQRNRSLTQPTSVKLVKANKPCPPVVASLLGSKFPQSDVRNKFTSREMFCL